MSTTCEGRNNMSHTTANGAQRATQTPRQVRARHAEVARRYAWHARKNQKYPRGSRPLIALVRLSDLEQLFRRRYGAILPCDDSGIDDLEIAAHHIAGLGGDAFNHIVAWAARWMPQMPRHETEALAARIVRDPRRFKARTLGWRLRLTDAEREEEGITTIEAVDVTPAERRKRKARERAAAWRQRQRKTKPAKPAPLSKTRPWKVLGMSRPTWYRKGKPMPENRPETRETKVRTQQDSLSGCVRDPSHGHSPRPETRTSVNKRTSDKDRHPAVRPRPVSNVVHLEAVSLWL
jgi:hypothetical protein